MIKNITKFCDELHADGVFRYTPPPDSPQNSHCEFSWYAQNETVLGYGASLVRDACEMGIRLVIRCHDTDKTYKYIYQVTRPEESLNETLAGDNVDNGLKHLSWLLLLIPLLVLLVLYYVYRKQIFSWFSHCCALMFCTKGPDAEPRADVPSSREQSKESRDVRANGCVNGDDVNREDHPLTVYVDELPSPESRRTVED